MGNKEIRQEKVMRIRAELEVEIGPSGTNCWHDGMGKIFFSDILGTKDSAWFFKATKRHWYTPKELRWIADRMDECKVRGIEKVSGCPQ